MDTVSFPDFMKMEIRIGKVLSAEKVENTERLLRLEMDMGGEKRTLVAGIGDVYAPEELPGKNIPVLANLEPKSIRGIESRGMILAADVDGKPVLLETERDVPAGSKVR